MTTSSLILNALVCRAIAAVRARSSQNFLRASADTATKPSAPRALAMRTTSEAAFATASSSRRRCRRAAPSSAGRGASPWSRSRPPSRSARRGARGPARIAPPGPRVEIALDLDDRRRGIAHLAEEFEAHGADRRRHPVQDEARADVMSPSQPSFCTPGSPARNLSVTSLPSPALRNAAPGNRERLACASASCRRRRTRRARTSRRAASWILPRLWSVPRHLEPFGVGRHHPPRDEIVERRAPQHRLLAAGVHRDVAADARGVGRRRIDGEDESRRLRRLHHAPRDHAGAAVDRRRPAPRRRGSAMRSTADRRSSFSVLITAERASSGTAPPV